MPEGQTAPPPLPKSQPSFGKRNSTIIKLLGVGALVLVLLIPLAMITGVLRERLQRRNEAVADITSSWGSEQNVIGEDSSTRPAGKGPCQSVARVSAYRLRNAFSS